MTRCHYVSNRLRAHVDRELSPAEEQRVCEHLETCAACAREARRVRETTRLASAVPLEETPAHFVASLQVRLRSQGARPRRGPLGLLSRIGRAPQLRWAVGAVGAVGLFLFAGAGLLTPKLSVAEIAERAEISWASIRHFESSISVEGYYRGSQREFVQKLWYQRPGIYRLETSLDYPLLTLVNEERVLHFLPGGTWDRHGPLVLVRPRKPGEENLPFPYGLAWPTSTANSGVEQLLRQLREDRDAVLEGTEAVGERDCYVVSFTATPPGGQIEEQLRVWIDRESFLPLRITRHRDEENHLHFTTEQMRVNNDAGMLPSGAFEFEPPSGARIIYGDVDPHVFGLRPRRTPEYDSAPLTTAWELATEAAPTLSFPLLLPDYLPAGYRLVRVTRAGTRALRVYWIHDRPDEPSRVLNLVLQSADEPDPLVMERGRTIFLDGEENIDAPTGTIVSGDRPYGYHYVSWRQGETLVTLFAADMSEEEALRIARSARPLLNGADGWEWGLGPADGPLPRDPGSVSAPHLISPPSLTPLFTEPPMLPEMLQEADDAPEPLLR